MTAEEQSKQAGKQAPTLRQCCSEGNTTLCSPSILPSVNIKGIFMPLSIVPYANGRAAGGLAESLHITLGCCAVLLLQNASQCPCSVLQHSSAPSHRSQTLLCLPSLKEFKLSIQTTRKQGFDPVKHLRAPCLHLLVLNAMEITDFLRTSREVRQSNLCFHSYLLG